LPLLAIAAEAEAVSDEDEYIPVIPAKIEVVSADDASFSTVSSLSTIAVTTAGRVTVTALPVVLACVEFRFAGGISRGVGETADLHSGTDSN
jgi:hypothetical protein